jgi:hypothetical protein
MFKRLLSYVAWSPTRIEYPILAMTPLPVPFPIRHRIGEMRADNLDITDSRLEPQEIVKDQLFSGDPTAPISQRPEILANKT